MPQIAHYYYNIVSRTTLMSQILEQSRRTEPTKNLVESLPVREGVKLSENTISWEDLRGLSWLFVEDGS